MKQAEVFRSQFAHYFEIHHPEVEEFLKLVSLAEYTRNYRTAVVQTCTALALVGFDYSVIGKVERRQ